MHQRHSSQAYLSNTSTKVDQNFRLVTARVLQKVKTPEQEIDYRTRYSTIDEKVLRANLVNFVRERSAAQQMVLDSSKRLSPNKRISTIQQDSKRVLLRWQKKCSYQRDNSNMSKSTDKIDRFTKIQQNRFE